MIIKKAFKFRLIPKVKQWKILAIFAGCHRFIYNRGLSQRIEIFEKQLGEEKVLVSKMKTQLVNLEDKIQEARTKHATLVAKKQAAMAREKILKNNKKWTGSAGKIINDFHIFEKFEEEILEDTSLLEAKEEINKESMDKNYEEKFSKMEKENNLDKELKALKKKIGE